MIISFMLKKSEPHYQHMKFILMKKCFVVLFTSSFCAPVDRDGSGADLEALIRTSSCDD